MSGLRASIAVERPGFSLDLELDVAAGGITAVVGPNGSGKSTTLRALAGLLRQSRGRVTLDDRVLTDVAAGILVAPAQRNIGVVFQDYLLFPHLSAIDNVAFGLIARHEPRKSANARARAWLERLGIGASALAKPAELSGGQAQRVALARALVLEPPLLLLDEPLAALDASTRIDVRREISAQLASYRGATVLVTHDAADALALADEMVVLDHGRAVQRGRVAEVAAAPANAYVAELLDAGTGQARGAAPAERPEIA